MKWVTLFCILLLLVPYVAAQEGSGSSIIIHFEMLDADSNTLLEPFPVTLQIIDLGTNKKTFITRFPDQLGRINYDFKRGDYEVFLRVDIDSTPEVDFLGSTSLNLTGGDPSIVPVLMYPVGTVDGQVVSSEEGDLVSHANLKFTCSRDIKGIVPNETDSFGFFETDSLPAGNCKAYASFGNDIGVADFEVRRGGRETLNIVLDRSRFIPQNSSISIFVLLVLAAGVVYYLFRDRATSEAIRKAIKKEVKKEIKEKVKLEPKQADKSQSQDTLVEEKQEKGLNPRARDVMETLNGKERDIVNYLLANQNKATQATIRRELGVPKTTISRIFQSLENKKVISIKKDGKVKNLELTAWFLGKE